MDKISNSIKKFLKEQQLAFSNQTVILAVSAGPDSMSLLAGFYQLSRQYDMKLIVAHVDHQLRPDSAAEYRLLREYCVARDITVLNKQWPIAEHPPKGLEASAREFRYSFFTELMRKYNASFIATAHHADDLLENILMKLIRSGDLREMTSPRAVVRQQERIVVRPLMGFSKKELLDYCQVNRIPFIVDETNQRDFTMRNRVRHHLVPLLKGENSQILQNALFMQEQVAQLDGLASSLVKRIPQPELLGKWHRGLFVGPRDALSDLETAQQALVYEKLIARYLQKSVKVDAKRLARLAKIDGGQVLELKQQVKLVVTRQHYFLVDAAQLELLLQTLPKHIAVDKQFVVGGDVFVVTKNKAALPNHILLGTFYAGETKTFGIRQVQPGDKVRLSDGAHQLVKKRFAPQGIPASVRNYFWGLTDEETRDYLWIDCAYTNQVIPKNSCHYAIYQVLKNSKEK